MRRLTESTDGWAVVAAGGVLWRPAADGGIETAIAHRPKYDDWSLPTGKLDPGEHPLQAAVREVTEETGLAVVAGRQGLRTTYAIPEGTKRVDYWLMQVVGGDFVPNAEVDELRWLPVPDAMALVSHEHDRRVLADAARTDVPRLPTLLLVRHAHAGHKGEWDGPDEQRPLSPRGREQARRLAEVLPVFGPTALASAARTRCRETLAPLAEALGLVTADLPELGEEEFAADPEAGLAVIERLLEPRAEPGVTVVCSQGGAIPSALMALGVNGYGTPGVYPPSAKGSVWAVGGRPGALTTDYYRDFAADPDAPPA